MNPKFKVGDLIQHKSERNPLYTFLILRIEQQKTKTTYELQRVLDNKNVTHISSIQYPNDYLQNYTKINHHRTKLGKILYKQSKN